MSNIELTQIVLDFESALLDGVRSGADEAALTKIRDEAFDRVLAVKESASPPPLETIFDVAGEMGRKLSMALKAIES